MLTSVIPFPNVPPAPPMLVCSFCYRPATEKGVKLIVGRGKCICTDCLAVCTELVKDA